MDLTEITIDPTAAWPPERLYWFNWTKTMCARIQASGKDVTGKFGKDWYLIACVCSIFGEAGRASFHIVSCLVDGYDEQKTNEEFNKALKRNKLKGVSKLRDILLAHQIDIKYTDPNAKVDVGHFLSNQGFDERAIMDAQMHGVCDRNCQMFSVDARRDDQGNVTGAAVKMIANFTLNIRFLIKDKERPLRIMDIEYKTPMGDVNKLTLAIPTDELGTRASFKRFIERHAGITFKGTDMDLEKIKERFFPYEKSATIINVLGWYNRDQIYFFNNGAIFEDRFFDCDRDGFIEVEEKVFYIPSANQNLWFSETDFQNKRNFIFIDNDASFDAWAAQFVKVYDKPGWLMMVHCCACLFSDIIFNYCHGFVIPYFVGPPSGGKGSMIKSGQRLWGEPQTPVAIPGKKATDKAKIRKLAQLCNALVLLDEYPEYATQDVVEGSKLLYDRLGDMRALKDFSYDTEEVPISSGLAMTSNYMPKDEPLLTRLMVIEVNYESRKNKDASKEFELLKDMERKGISAIARHILHYRDSFKSRFVPQYKKVLEDVAPLLKAKGIKEDRMIKNVTMILATYNALKEHLNFPFTYAEFRNYLVASMASQNSRRKSEDKVSAWWTVFLKNIKERKLKHGFHFDIDGDRLALVWMPAYTEFTETFKRIYNRTAPARIEMVEMLQQSEYYVEHKQSYRFKNTEEQSVMYKKERITAVMVFDMNELMKSQFDIVYATQTANEEGSTFNGQPLDIDDMARYRKQQENQVRDQSV